jgi:hypothetical protein
LRNVVEAENVNVPVMEDVVVTVRLNVEQSSIPRVIVSVPDTVCAWPARDIFADALFIIRLLRALPPEFKLPVEAVVMVNVPDPLFNVPELRSTSLPVLLVSVHVFEVRVVVPALVREYAVTA